MALNFPSAPNVNATYTFSDKTWTYNGNAWALSYGTLDTTTVSEGTNLYFTNTRARVAISVSGSGSYDNSTGVINITGTTITDDTTTNSTRYLTLTSSSSGSVSTANVATSKLFFNPSTGLLTSTDYNSSSDKRFKENIKTVDNALNTVSALRGVTFNWIEGGNKSIGLIAQEVKDVIPDLVTTDESGFLGIKYNNIIGLLVEAIKEQQKQIDTLKERINIL